MDTVLPPTVVKKIGDEEFPFLEDMYFFFSKKGKTLEVYSYGLGNAGIEAEICEQMGCFIKIFDGREGKKEAFDKIINVLQTHKVNENDEQSLKDLSLKWILPNKFQYNDYLPWSFDGTLESIKLKKIDVNEVPQIDVLKIDYSTYNTSILLNIIESGYRPGMIFIKWDKHPDMDVNSMIGAGNLQTVGYRLLGVKGNWFMYIYTDSCMYDIVSWARTDCNNPMFEEIKTNILQAIKK
jgi:hypothetical protein